MTKRVSQANWEKPLTQWFASKGWKPAKFQRDVWKHQRDGKEGLVLTPTGSGKTLAVLGGALLRAAEEASSKGAALKILWITPLRALATDTVRAIEEPVKALGLNWTVAMRTGDGSSRDRRLARQGKAEIIVITPESLELELSYADSERTFANVSSIIVDEWHELLDNKRGVLLQLSLARVREIAAQAKTWGLSATIGNPEQARDVLIPENPHAVLIGDAKPRPVKITTLLPEHGERFPWAGHLGLSQLARVTKELGKARTSIIFCNTRAQAELWHRALSTTWMDDPETLALHHGSLSMGVRQSVEKGVRDGQIRCVVSTSSLDLGVDFPEVDQVFQVGSPKGLSRLLQRAGRAKHQPGETGVLLSAPTHALELAEFAAAREALKHHAIEPRVPLTLTLDVLAQHCVTRALGGGFESDGLFEQVKKTHAFRHLTKAQWEAVLKFIVQGGEALEHYPEYRRVTLDNDGIYRVNDRRIAFRHRLSIGTITSDGAMLVKYAKGGTLGSVEEQFITRLKPRDVFHFAGKALELVQVRDMTAFVRLAKNISGTVPRWQGGRMPLSTALATWVRKALAGEIDSPEMKRLRPLLELQSRVSALPTEGTLLAEWIKTREGWQLFFYPFAGRSVHEGLAALIALRWSRHAPNTITFACNDYGLVLRAQGNAKMTPKLLRELLDPLNLLEDLEASVNLSELARRQFREVARVAGLLPPNMPGKQQRNMRQLQASGGLLFDVLERYDPQHILLAQARREVLETQLGFSGLRDLLDQITHQKIDWKTPERLTPLSFPLWAEMARGTLSSEAWKDRVQRAAQQLEQRYAV